MICGGFSWGGGDVQEVRETRKTRETRETGDNQAVGWSGSAVFVRLVVWNGSGYIYIHIYIYIYIYTHIYYTYIYPRVHTCVYTWIDIIV